MASKMHCLDCVAPELVVWGCVAEIFILSLTFLQAAMHSLLFYRMLFHLVRKAMTFSDGLANL